MAVSENPEQCHRRQGVTLVELLVVIGIVVILIGLLLPAVQNAREAARRTQCISNLRQIGIAVSNHEAAYRHLPSGGWGFTWVGDSRLGSGRSQPGGWIYQLLPYIEQQNLMRLDVSGGDEFQQRAAMLGVPIPTLTCPSRPLANPSPYLGQFPLVNSQTPNTSFKTDYAACGGDVELPGSPGPSDGLPATLRGYGWGHVGVATGVIFQFSHIRVRDISDGLSNTYLVGEKRVQVPASYSPESRDPGHDQAALIGDDHDIRRWTGGRPTIDGPIARSEVFGSSHPSGWQAVYCDGSVRTLAYGLDGTIHRSLGNRSDGNSAALPD
jgi:hypothetical protein